MLIATQGKSVIATRQYFETVLTQGDYYLGQEVSGQWHGRGADSLGLGRGSDVTKDQFSSLLEGRHPKLGTSLTQRLREDRRPGMDLTFSVPKSVSLAWAINGDERILDALRKSVQETMAQDVEPLMQRRVRTGQHAATKQRTQTGKLIYADFLHKTSRPVDGKPDPHLHIHAFVINWTEQNGKHYAGEFAEIVRQRPSLQAKFEARLARTLKNELGYAVEKSRFMQSGRLKSGWEIKGLSRDTVMKFSRRTKQVEEVAKKNGITNEAEKSKLGAKTREKKQTGLTIDHLRKEWRSRLTDDERKSFGGLQADKQRDQSKNENAQAEQSLKHALDHHLYRQSTVEQHQVIGTALEHGLTVSPEQMKQTFDRMQVIRRSRDVEGAQRKFVTTREVLNSEKEMINFARDGRGTRKAIGKREHVFARTWLNDQQQAAVKHVLNCRDTVMAVTGGAGTGKSSLMEEAAEAVRGNGKEVFTFAPSTGAREVLQEKGFSNAQTVEHLLRNKELQAEIRNQVLWVDEAGLLDVRSMQGIFKIAKAQNARVVLSGDTRQHSSPRRGEAMRLLENQAGLNIARVEAIQRQKGKYRDAVAMISRGHEVVDARTGKTGLLAGFDMLDRMGKIKECEHEHRHQLLAKQYLQSGKKGKTILIVAPTHAEAGAVTKEIRDGLRRTGGLESQEHSVPQLRSLNLSEAEKSDASSYACREGAVVQFHQNTQGGFKRGERYRITATDGDSVEVAAVGTGVKKSLPLKRPDRFEVYNESELGLSVGDKLRFSLGGTGSDGKRRISNGRLDEVKGFDRNGNVRLKSGFTVNRDYGHLDLGYVVTSHSSQGKDRQVAIAAMGAESLPAINAKQFYVTVSRGSEDVAIYVDDKAKVRQAIGRSGEQLAATELVNERPASSPENTATPTALYEQRRHQSLFQTFRNRVTSWWKSRQDDPLTRKTQGREKTIRPDSTFGMGPGPQLGRG